MSVIKNGRVLNWRRDRLGGKGPPFKDLIKGRLSLPSRVDLRAKCPPIVDQGQIGSCTGNALAGALGYLEICKDPAFLSTGQFQPLSRLFIYWNERAIEGDTGQDAGATLHDGVSAL